MIGLAAEAMCKNTPEGTGERGVLISTASSAFGTPMLFGMPKEVQDAPAAGVPFLSRPRHTTRTNRP
jgi:hypothetical protein